MRAKQEIVRHGRAIAVSPHGGRIVVAHDRRRTIAILSPSRGRSKILDVGGQPVDVAVSPDGRFAAVTTGFWDQPSLAIVDLHAGKVTKHVDIGPAPFAPAFTPSGKRLVVTGGEQEGSVHVLDTKTFTVSVKRQIGTVPRGVAPLSHLDAAWVALNGSDQVVRVNLKSGRIEKTLPTPRLPDRVAISPDGRRLLVSHGGSGADHVSEIEVASGRVHSHNVGRLPSAVAWTANGHKLVALGGSSEIVRIGAAHRRVRRSVAVAPRGLAVAGGRAWTVSALTGEVSAVRT
jgi:DNA-binding beta-propeller fold protein YncE